MATTKNIIKKERQAALFYAKQALYKSIMPVLTFIFLTSAKQPFQYGWSSETYPPAVLLLLYSRFQLKMPYRVPKKPDCMIHKQFFQVLLRQWPPKPFYHSLRAEGQAARYPALRRFLTAPAFPRQHRRK